jgi:hypothetical protein
MNIQAITKLAPLLLSKKRGWLGLLVLSVIGSQFLDIKGMPSFGLDTLWKEPRDVLVDRVGDARDAQQDTVQQFRTAMEEFKSVTGFDGGELEDTFDRLNSAFENSEAAVNNINSRIDRVVSATNKLLDEWRDELEQYHDPSIKQQAQAQFDETRNRAEQMIALMRSSAEKTKPILDVFRDQVLYLKHNLNMQAITELDGQTEQIEGDVAALIVEMERSIAEANAFIAKMGEA